RRAEFAFETTLSGRTYEPMLREFRRQGYTVYLHFLWLPAVEMNIERVANRVREGGHNVPEDDVRRAIGAGSRTSCMSTRQLADSWTLFDNAGQFPREIAFALGDEPTILDTDAFQRFVKAGDEP